jgi:hypothetical protein
VIYCASSHMYVVYIIMYCDHEGNQSRFFWHITCFQSLDNEKMVFGIASLCMPVLIRTSLAPEKLDGFYTYLVFKS